MNVHFEFKDGSNPYITFNNSALWDMIRNFDIEQTGNKFFVVNGRMQLLTVKKTTEYQKNKAILRTFAQEWQYDFNDRDYSYMDLVEWQSFFKTYGKKYGLLKEFQENGIL